MKFHFYTLLTKIPLAHALLQPSPELRVDTSSGVVHGIYNDTTATVRGFLGIPYAEPPVHDLRFAQPRKRSPLPSPIDASSFSKPCPQMNHKFGDSILDVLPYQIWNVNDISEDCLYLNVWAPSAKHSGETSKAAVMVFIHGGDYEFGGTSIAYYDGTNMVRDNKDLIVVTLKLNVFGFPNTPGLDPARRNPGLQDQRLAIHWVHENIARFGGDPERITVFGQSAGAGSADMYSYAYPDDPIIKAIILQSGTRTIHPLSYSVNDWDRLATALNCGTGLESMACMMESPMIDIIQAMENGTYNFIPTPDEITVFSDYPSRAKQGKLAKLPTLGGFDEKELSFSYSLSSPSINESAVFQDAVQNFSCPLLEALQYGLSHEVANLLTYYIHRSRIKNNIPTWRYLYRGNFHSLSPKPWLGAYHTCIKLGLLTAAAEIPLVFGTYNTTAPGFSPPSESLVQTSRYMQGAWVAFAKDPLNGLNEYGWPQFTLKGESTSQQVPQQLELQYSKLALAGDIQNNVVNLGLGNQPFAVMTTPLKWDSQCSASQI
ncbi:hypothetical protein N7532_010740 [Penicillium argentinense]|uniref:Carboxylic ester hydrolase n=1 Tax=Penicillium argentinense TaxID=1131581 RepID=A0A9W9EQC7_9EURO|nr:uncharacterized protein N7532_010740 [Penicillium argentinense]KAJ5085969.1 hypothetical protein N7532_010740 [Penicillium argentinense]